jgi:hypothetical protein
MTSANLLPLVVFAIHSHSAWVYLSLRLLNPAKFLPTHPAGGEHGPTTLCKDWQTVLVRRRTDLDVHGPRQVYPNRRAVSDYAVR